mgnify:CR=1 FL=1
MAVSTRQALLQALSAAGGSYVSGQQLAETLGVSRAAVHKAAAALTAQGYALEAAPRRGYRLAGGDPFCAEAVGPYPAPIHIYDTLQSSNLTAKQLALGGAPHGTLVLTAHQKAGRGRLGRRFESPAGKGVYLSLILRPTLSAADAQSATISAAVAVARALHIDLDYERQLERVREVCVRTADNRASMLQDILRGRATQLPAINGAVGRGTTVVVAAGNSNTNVSSSVPANCPNVIAVAATTSAGSRASFSNYGTGIDISAPGQSILSTLNTGTTTPGSASYASYNGTSMAAPHVAGVVALMQAAATSPLTPAAVESTLKSTARPLPGSCSGGCGAGIANADGAVTAVQGGGPDPDPGTQTYTNGTDVSIPDNNSIGVSSTIAVSGRSGNAPSNAQVAVNIVHTYIGDLIVDLIAPDGSVYVLHNRTGGSAVDIIRSATVNLSSEALNGSWRLRARDRASIDTGYINSWSITF